MLHFFHILSITGNSNQSQDCNDNNGFDFFRVMMHERFFSHGGSALSSILRNTVNRMGNSYVVQGLLFRFHEKFKFKFLTFYFFKEDVQIHGAMLLEVVVVPEVRPVPHQHYWHQPTVSNSKDVNCQTKKVCYFYFTKNSNSNF